MLFHKERRDAATVLRVENPTPVFVWVTPEAYQKTNTLVELAEKEVGWMEEVTRERINGVIVLTVHDIHILEQTVSAARFDFTDDAWMKFVESFDTIEEFEAVNERLRGCGHSHVNMGVSKSTGDEDMAQLFIQNGVCTWFLESRANKRGERQFDYNDAEQGLMYIDVPWAVKHDYKDYTSFIEQELKDKVVESTYKKGYYSSYEYDELYGFGKDTLYSTKYRKRRGK